MNKTIITVSIASVLVGIIIVLTSYFVYSVYQSQRKVDIMWDYLQRVTTQQAAVTK